MVAGEGGAEEIGRRRRRLGSLNRFARSGGEEEGLGLYSAPHPAQVGGDSSPRNETCKNPSGVPDLGGLLDGRVEPNPVYRQLFYGVGPFEGSVRLALSASWFFPRPPVDERTGAPGREE